MWTRHGICWLPVLPGGFICGPCETGLVVISFLFVFLPSCYFASCVTVLALVPTQVTVAVAGCTGIFGIVLVLLTHFTTLSVGAVVGISAGAGVVVAALFTVFYKAAPSLFSACTLRRCGACHNVPPPPSLTWVDACVSTVVLFAVYTINNVLVAMEIPYTKLGWYIILIEAGAILVVFGMSLGKGLKKCVQGRFFLLCGLCLCQCLAWIVTRLLCRGACVLGIAAVSSTLVVDCVLWYPAPILPEYVGIMYAGVFVLSLFIQPCTGKGQVRSWACVCLVRGCVWLVLHSCGCGSCRLQPTCVRLCFAVFLPRPAPHYGVTGRRTTVAPVLVRR